MQIATNTWLCPLFWLSGNRGIERKTRKRGKARKTRKRGKQGKSIFMNYYNDQFSHFYHPNNTMYTVSRKLQLPIFHASTNKVETPGCFHILQFSSELLIIKHFIPSKSLLLRYLHKEFFKVTGDSFSIS